MKVLVVGSGGREHALAWKLKQSPKVDQVYIAPGNPGTKEVGENVTAESVGEILEWLRSNAVDMVVIGPDKYLAEGLADSVEDLGVPVFGPTKAAAEIEWSKAYAKQLMLDADIPTAAYQVFVDGNSARTYVRGRKLPLVIKADGLAAGKGVVVAQTLLEADEAIANMLEDKKFGESGSRIVIEEYLEGLEISTHAFCDGENATMFPSSKDHKRVFSDDKGPNTGGMGTVVPVPSVSDEQLELIKKQIVLPTLAALKERGRTFKGVLYPGIMLTKDGPKVIELNARFGDPETQSYMLLLETDLFEILYACATGKLAGTKVKWRDEFACCVVLAAKGYPENPEKGARVTILPFGPADAMIFHAGTAKEGGNLAVSGGRVLGVAAKGKTLQDALNKAYGKIAQIDFSGKQYRKDIGASVL